MKYVYTLIFLFVSLSLFAQEMSVTGRVVDTDNQGLSFVTVLLYSEDGDSALKGATTDEDGSFTFTDLPIHFSHFLFVPTCPPNKLWD